MEAKKKGGLWSKFLVFLGILAIVAIGIYIRKQIQKKQVVQKEVANIEEEIDKVIKENKKLAEQISYFSTKDFKEKEAKDKLNMQFENEEVVVIKPEPAVISQQENSQEPAIQETENLENWQKWYNLFFKY